MPVFERDVKTSRNNVYRLRILVGENYPERLPDLVARTDAKICGMARNTYNSHVASKIRTFTDMFLPSSVLDKEKYVVSGI